MQSPGWRRAYVEGYEAFRRRVYGIERLEASDDEMLEVGER